MTSNDSTGRRKRAATTSDDVVQRETAFHAACFRFTASLTSLRVAISFTNKALSSDVLLDGDYTREKALDMHARWAGASRVMQESLEAIARDGGAMIEAVLKLSAED